MQISNQKVVIISYLTYKHSRLKYLSKGYVETLPLALGLVSNFCTMQLQAVSSATPESFTSFSFTAMQISYLANKTSSSSKAWCNQIYIYILQTSLVYFNINEWFFVRILFVAYVQLIMSEQYIINKNSAFINGKNILVEQTYYPQTTR